MAASADRVYARYLPINRVSPAQIREMYALYSRYYENTSLDIFLNDMARKSGVFLIRRRTDGRIVGFSTVTRMVLTASGRPVRGVFSGDTVIEKEYWGNRALQVSFLLYLLRTRFRYPLSPMFWLLISKGYKTYLLLANNFPRYYPNPDGENGNLAPLVRDYCQQLFPDAWVEHQQLLDFGDRYQCLREEVAEITPDMRKRHPRIAYFEQCNPSWRRGTELPCIGQMGYRDAFVGVYRYLKKLVSRRPKKATVVPETCPEPVVEAVAQRGAQ